MAYYRYYSSDLLTGNVLAELPLSDVNLGRQLSAAGDLSGTYKLGSGIFDDQTLLSGSIPQKTALYVERDGVIIWGGIIWSRTYDSSSHLVAISASTFESFFDRVVVLNDFIQQNIDQLQIFKSLIDALQNQAGSNIGLDTSQMSVSSGVIRTVLVPGYEYHFASETVSTLISAENSFDYMIDVVPSNVQDVPSKIVRVGYPKIGQDSTSGVAMYDYPGNVASYTLPEAGGGTRFAVLGNGSGSSMLRSEQAANDLLSLGYPSWWVVKAFKSLSVASEVALKAAAVRDQYKVPITTPTFTLKPDYVPQFDAWSALGVNMNVYIEDKRFPSGQTVTSRMIGWTLVPKSANGSEQLSLTIEGLSDA